MGNRPRHFWRALETVPGLSAVDAEWRMRFGAEYALAKSFLRPNGRLASAHPCTVRPGCGCSHEVVVHGQDDIVAVCRCGVGCETFSLTRSDIAVYEVDVAGLAQALAGALNLMGEQAPEPGLHQTTRLGTYAPTAGFHFPVYLTIQLEPSDFDHTVNSIVSQTDAPFILLAPTQHHCQTRTERALATSKSAFIPLSEEVVIGTRGRFCRLRPVDDILFAFRAAHLPALEEEGSMEFFPTPPEATWGDVAIRFRDGHTVSIQVKSKRRVCNYTQMGMANLKNGDPTSQWKLLEGLANSHGQIDWHSRYAALNVKKQKQELSKRLRKFFRIDADPIEWVKDTKSYKCRFEILPIGGDEY